MTSSSPQFFRSSGVLSHGPYALPSMLRSRANDQRHGRRARAADIECGDLLGAVNLIVTRLTSNLLASVQCLTRTSGANRVAAADETATRIDRQFTAEFNHPLFDHLPGFSRFRKTEVIDRHIFRRDKAIVSFDALHAPHIGNACATKRILNRLSSVR